MHNRRLTVQWIFEVNVLKLSKFIRGKFQLHHRLQPHITNHLVVIVTYTLQVLHHVEDDVALFSKVIPVQTYYLKDSTLLLQPFKNSTRLSTNKVGGIICCFKGVFFFALSLHLEKLANQKYLLIYLNIDCLLLLTLKLPKIQLSHPKLVNSTESQ